MYTCCTLRVHSGHSYHTSFYHNARIVFYEDDSELTNLSDRPFFVPWSAAAHMLMSDASPHRPAPYRQNLCPSPLPNPQLRLLLTRNWMGCKGPVYRFGNGVNVPCIGGDWILVAARVFPFIIVALFDTALFYQFIVTAFGIYHGLIKLDLGVVSTWDDLVREFHKSPPR